MTSTLEAHADQHGHAGGDHGAHHDPEAHIAHHFDDAQQQFDAGKLGIWAFLVTEILFFSGLFCAYSVYRNLHPEVFVYASTFLDTSKGAINTGVLILSSLTAAWAVRNAQLGQKKMLVVNILITIACACAFMVVKYFEYTHKFHLGVFPGGEFTYAPSEHDPEMARKVASIQSLLASDQPLPHNVQLFFSIYYGMTGLHGFHVLFGIIVWVWILKRALKGEFNPKFFGPVDFTALYWHIVDVIWIYLFPLLYLIH